MWGVCMWHPRQNKKMVKRVEAGNWIYNIVKLIILNRFIVLDHNFLHLYIQRKHLHVFRFKNITRQLTCIKHSHRTESITNAKRFGLSADSWCKPIVIFPPSHFVCPLFHFGMFQNIVLFLKIKTINLLMLLLYPY